MEQNAPWTGEYPVRCQILDVTGQHVLEGIEAKTPEISKPHIGKKGTAEEIKNSWRVKITLDDGNIIYGEDCWWKPLPQEEIPQIPPQ